LLMLCALLAAAYALRYGVPFDSSHRFSIPQELQSPDLSLWIAVLLVQSLPYAAALIVACISALSPSARWLGERKQAMDMV
jgi:hypothetical protein